jgi:hypothetical protein
VRSRPFLTRLLLAALGMLIFCLLGVIGIGWAVRAPSYQFAQWAGYDRVTRVHHAYLRALGTILPADRDGDGFPDSVEWYLKSDPGDPGRYPKTDFLLESTRSFVAEEVAGELLWHGDCRFVVCPGERCHVRLQMGIGYGPAVFAPGMRVLLHPEQPGCLLSLPDGASPAPWLLVPMATDGTLNFDVLVPADAEGTGQMSEPTIRAIHPVSGSAMGFAHFAIARRLPTVPVTVKELPPDSPDRYTGPGRTIILTGPVVALDWKPVAEPLGPYLIEASQEPATGDWFPIAICDFYRHSAIIQYSFQDPRLRANGRLSFRVIPTRSSPSEEEKERAREERERPRISGHRFALPISPQSSDKGR